VFVSAKLILFQKIKEIMVILFFDIEKDAKHVCGNFGEEMPHL